MENSSNKRILLVGEAPGHHGCGVTGIPFTSGRVFEEIEHPLLRALKDKIIVPYMDAESTATIVWEYLSGKSCIPLFWNSFPFHPHLDKNSKTNRTPIQNEIAEGVEYLRLIREWFNPDIIAGVGWNGVNGLKKAFPNEKFTYIRHPSYGGKSEFINGMDKIF